MQYHTTYTCDYFGDGNCSISIKPLRFVTEQFNCSATYCHIFKGGIRGMYSV